MCVFSPSVFGMAMRPCTDAEFADLPHLVLTSDVDWDPRVLDFDTDDDAWYDAISDNVDHADLFDAYGDYKGRTEIDVSSADTWFDTVTPDQCTRAQMEDATITCSEHAYHVRHLDNDDFADVLLVDDAEIIDPPSTVEANDDLPPAVISDTAPDVDDDDPATTSARTFKVQDRDYEKLRPLFGWANAKIIKKTFEMTTQCARMPHGTILKKHCKSPFPALNVQRPTSNVQRRDEPVATDTVFSDTPAIDGGETCGQIFVGTETLVTDVCGMKSEKQFVNTLEDNIREQGAMSRLLSDGAQVEISTRVLGILRALHIGQWQSEPHQQHVLDPEDHDEHPLGSSWFPCVHLVTLSYVRCGAPESDLQHHPWWHSTAMCSRLHARHQPSSSFYWWEPVYFKVDDVSFPSTSREERGHFVGMSRNVGHAMTYKILCDKSLAVLHRANLRSANNPSDPNLRLDPLDGENLPLLERIVKSVQDDAEDDDDQVKPMIYFDTGDLIGRTFLMEKDDDRLRSRAQILEVIDDHEKNVADNPVLKKFRCQVDEEEFEEILSYNEVMHHIEKEDDDGETFWKYKRISGHEGPLTKTRNSWKGDKCNVKVE
jgi:hypothetical protein